LINNVNIPEKDNTGRAFPFNDSEEHFVGPAVINGEVHRVSIWINKSSNGRSYLRMVFESINQD
jgi:hypothetical protein